MMATPQAEGAEDGAEGENYTFVKNTFIEVKGPMHVPRIKTQPQGQKEKELAYQQTTNTPTARQAATIDEAAVSDDTPAAAEASSQPAEASAGSSATGDLKDGGAALKLAPATAPTLTVSEDERAITWSVDAAKLRSKDKSAVSPAFKLHGGSSEFKIFLFPSDGERRADSFQKAQGRSVIHLKCFGHDTGEPMQLYVRFAVGNQEWSNAVLHDFAQSAVCQVPKEWDLKTVAGSSKSFAVSLEITPPPALVTPKE